MNSQTLLARSLFFNFPKPLRTVVSFVLTVSLFAFSVAPALSQRAITNPSIEDPAFPDSQVVQQAEGTMPGWLTSHPVQTGACSGADCRPIERWSNGAVGVLPATGAGSRWVELNAFTASMIYQSICMTNGESFSYSFAHRGRQSATEADVAQFRLGIPTGLPAGSKPADSYSFPIASVSTENDGGGAAPTAHPNATASFAAAGNGWRRYSGMFLYTGTTQIVNIGFVAISTAGGAIAAGNLIDDLQITLSPYLEFSSAAASGNEGSSGTSNTPANRPAIRIGGTVTAPVTVTVQVTGGSAVVGDDYSLTEPYQAGNATATTSVFIPAGTYDGVSAGSFFPIPFSISPDTATESNETVEFNLTSAPGATIASIVGCGVAPVVNSTFTIQNDDAPTAADATISGRVATPDGRGIGKVVITLQGGELSEPRTALTNAFGYYFFEGLDAGETYVVSVQSKRYRFNEPVRVINLGEDATGVDFVASP